MKAVGRRLRALDIALLVTLTPLWLVCFSLYVKELASGRLAWIPLSVSFPETQESYPTVREFWPNSQSETSGLAIGDQVLAVGKTDLRGVGPLGFVVHVYESTTYPFHAPLVLRRGGAEIHSDIQLLPLAFPWRMLPLSCGLVLAAVVILARTSGSRPARALFAASLAYSLHWTFFFGASRVQTAAWLLVFCLSSCVMFPLVLRAALLFPEELEPTGKRIPSWPWSFALFGPMVTSWLLGIPFSPTLGLHAIFLMNIVFIVVLLTILWHHFRQASAFGRRQLKWVLYGFYLSTAPVLATDLVTMVAPALWWVHEVSMLAMVVLPVCLWIAILHAGFFDIDHLIRVTTTYSLCFVVFIGGASLLVPQLSLAASTMVGLAFPLGQMSLTVLSFALVVSIRHFLRDGIETWFFPERRVFQQGMQHLLQDVTSCGSSDQLLSLAAARLHALLAPESCVVYQADGVGYTPLCVEGSIVPPPLPLTSVMLQALPAFPAPLDLADWKSLARGSLEADERARLEQLRARLMVALDAQMPPRAVLCLGAKRSGDIYTPTEVAALTQLAQHIGDTLARTQRSLGSPTGALSAQGG